MIYEVEHVQSTAPFKCHKGGVMVSTIWNVNIKLELPNKRLTFRWNFIRDIAAAGGLKMPPNRTAYLADKANEADLHSVQTIIPRYRQIYIFWNLFESYNLEDGSKENARAKFLQALCEKNALNVTGPKLKNDQMIVYRTCFR